MSILKCILFFTSAALVVCSVCVGYTSCICNINDNSNNTSKSIHLFIMPHEKVTNTNMTLFENVLSQWIILNCVVKSDTVFVQWLSSLCETSCELVVVRRLCIKLFGEQKGGSAACCEGWSMSQRWSWRPVHIHKSREFVGGMYVFLFTWFIYFLWLLILFQVQGGCISCKGWVLEDLSQLKTNFCMRIIKIRGECTWRA